jgi:TrmH family RNA methyltransferase
MQKIESRDNPYIKHLCKLRDDRSYRDEMQKVLVEGKQLVEEISSRVNSGTVFAVEEWNFHHLNQVLISEGVAGKLSNHFAELPMPKPSLPEQCRKILALDGVSDPGNLGTLLRTALALGWDGVFFLPGCCDPFNDKAIRASKGALFKLPYRKGSWEEFDKFANDYQLLPLAADLHGEKPELYQNQNCLLLLGNEGQGLSREGQVRGKKISIPIRGEMESLNVAAAGAILMYIIGES